MQATRTNVKIHHDECQNVKNKKSKDKVYVIFNSQINFVSGYYGATKEKAS